MIRNLEGTKIKDRHGEFNETNEGYQCLKFCGSVCCCSVKLVHIRQQSGELGSECHNERGWVCNKRPGNSARPAPTVQGVTAEYTWPGSFRAHRDN